MVEQMYDVPSVFVYGRVHSKSKHLLHRVLLFDEALIFLAVCTNSEFARFKSTDSNSRQRWKGTLAELNKLLVDDSCNFRFARRDITDLKLGPTHWFKKLLTGRRNKGFLTFRDRQSGQVFVELVTLSDLETAETILAQTSSSINKHPEAA